MHVPQEPVVAIDAIEPRIDLEDDPRTRSSESGELTRRGARVALPTRFRRIDLDEANPRASANDEGVPVHDPLDGRCATCACAPRPCGSGDRDECEKSGG
jgi:hypothetical protein